jgi:outer membrane receptor for ferrienterochelin and colicin
MSVKGLRTKHAFFSACLSSMLICHVTTIHAEDLWNMSLEELQSVRVTSIATGTETPLDKAASVVSVITADDIAEMGATDLNHVLESVPGLHIGLSDQAYFPKFTFRGITSKFNPHALMLINGVPITGLFSGNRGHIWGGVPVKSVERIEVIRGPGSALYGADAFAGVINVITKSAKDLDGTTLGVRGGSFDTYGGWVTHGDTYDGYEFGTTLEYQSQNSWDEEIVDILGKSQDANTAVDALDLRLELAKGDWRVRAGYQNRNDLGVANGLAQSHDSNGQYDSDRANIDYTHLFDGIADNFELESRLSYYYYTQQIDTNTTLFPVGSPGFPEGVIGAPSYREEQARFDLSGLFDGIGGHFMRFGIGGFWGDIYETTELKNFDLNLALLPFPFDPRGSLDDVSDTPDVFLPEKDRTSYYAFVQDEWQLADDWALTSGLRYDKYSDFGGTTNPRVALVWATTDAITTKLLYGKAFRAPSFNELFVTANPIALGNSELEPEIIDSYELALSHQIDSKLSYNLNVFFYEIDDYIQFGASGAENTGRRNGKGGEAELEYRASSSLKLFANYAYQRSMDKNSDTYVGEAPNHQFYTRVQLKTDEGLHITPQFNWVGKQKRVAGDTRTEPLDDYSYFDLTVRQTGINERWDLSATVRNLFNADIREPSPSGGVPSDFIKPGRHFVAELSYKL